MLDDRMVTKKGAKLSRKPKTTPASTFAEIGRHAAREAVRRLEDAGLVALGEGSRGRYIDAAHLPLKATVALVPPIGSAAGNVVALPKPSGR